MEDLVIRSVHLCKNIYKKATKDFLDINHVYILETIIQKKILNDTYKKFMKTSLAKNFCQKIFHSEILFIIKQHIKGRMVSSLDF